MEPKNFQPFPIKKSFTYFIILANILVDNCLTSESGSDILPKTGTINRTI